MPGELRLDLHLAGTRLNASHEVDEDQGEPGVPDEMQPHRHLLSLEMQDAAVSLYAGLPKRWTLELQAPLRRVHVDAEFEDGDGELLPGFESIHHRTETIRGLGDVAVAARRRLLFAEGRRWSLDLRVGVTLPTGETEPDPFHLGEEGEEHQHIFFGHGSVDPLIGFDTGRSVGELGLQGWARARVPVTDNSHGYRAGAMVAGGFSVFRSLGSSGLMGRAQVELYHEEPSRWSGQDARNSGRTDAIAGLGLSWSPQSAPWLVHLLVRVPENLSARGGQIDPEPVVTFGFSTALRVSREVSSPDEP